MIRRKLSGYEPSLAEKLALSPQDIKSDVFQSMSDKYSISIAVGYPVKFSDGIKITMIIFQPEKETLFYSKQFFILMKYLFLMANAVGKADNFICAGQSAIWDREGKLLIQVNATQEALLVLDTETGKVMMIEKDHCSRSE